MFDAYFPAFLMLLVATIFAVAMFTLTSSLGTKRMTPEKAEPLAGGFLPAAQQILDILLRFG
jgi:NADH:ubiquinone oxidoreductase subunit 3 (subunit A)